MVASRVVGLLVGIALLFEGRAVAQVAQDVDLRRPCTFMFQVPGGATQLRGLCPNHYGGVWEIVAVACDANMAGITVLPKLARAGDASVLAAPLTCGTNQPAGVAGKGKLNVRQADGATCSKNPCDLEVIITAPNDNQPHSGLISIIGALTLGPKP